MWPFSKKTETPREAVERRLREQYPLLQPTAGLIWVGDEIIIDQRTRTATKVNRAPDQDPYAWRSVEELVGR